MTDQQTSDETIVRVGLCSEHQTVQAHVQRMSTVLADYGLAVNFERRRTEL